MVKQKQKKQSCQCQYVIMDTRSDLLPKLWHKYPFRTTLLGRVHDSVCLTFSVSEYVSS